MAWSVLPAEQAERPRSLCQDGEYFAGIEYPRLNEVEVFGFEAQLGRGARQAHPIEHLVLARILDLAQRDPFPSLVVAPA